MKLLLSHGAAGKQRRAAAEKLAGQVADELGEPVGAVFLGDELPGAAELLPMFLTRGRHTERDVPAQAAATGATLLAGPADFPAEMAQMALDLVQSARVRQRAVMFALHGLIGAKELMAELYDRSKQFPLPAIAGLHGVCDVSSVLALWRNEQVGEALIQPLLMFPGHSMDVLRQTADDSGLDIALGPVLSEHEGFARWLADRFRAAG